MCKLTLKTRLLAEKEISYRKLNNRYKTEFNLLGINPDDNIQQKLYDYCYDDCQSNHKCSNPECNNTVPFGSFKTGYKDVCSRSCSNKVTPRGRQGEKYLTEVKERRIAKAENIKEEAMMGIHVCEHGCGRTARHYSEQKKTWRCEERVQDCPNVKESISDSISRATLGVSKSSYSVPVTTSSHVCDYGCGKVAKWGLSGGKFCCESTFHKCDKIRQNRSELISTRINNGTWAVNPWKTKDYAWPSGKLSKVMGYEDLALDEILKEFHEDDVFIGTEGTPLISYLFEGKTRTYIPDIFIQSINTIIEVKSEYTLLLDKEVNLAKRQATIDAGYEFVWFMFENRKTKRMLLSDEIKNLLYS